jgi:hypothetical protein
MSNAEKKGEKEMERQMAIKMTTTASAMRIVL